MTAADTLRGARALLEQCGWTQGLSDFGGYRRAGEWGAICPVDAIIRVVLPRRSEALACLARAVGGASSIDIVAWNGVWGRTLDQVYNAFDRAIEIAEVGR